MAVAAVVIPAIVAVVTWLDAKIARGWDLFGPRCRRGIEKRRGLQ
jgi:hypothetical protein